MIDGEGQSIDTTAILYPTLTYHPPPTPHPIVVLSLSELLATPSTVSDDNLLKALLAKLDPWAGELDTGGFVLVVLAAERPSNDGRLAVQASRKGKERARELPGISWWIWGWRRIPRRYRKNLKRLYIVHPSPFTRRLLPVILPLVSPKAYPKLYPTPSILSLYRQHRISLQGINVSLESLYADAKHLTEHPDLDLVKQAKRGGRAVSAPERGWASWSYSVASSVWGSASRYLPLSRQSSSSAFESVASTSHDEGYGYWGRSAKDLAREAGGGLPSVLRDLSEAILQRCTDTEGIFRRSSRSPIMNAVIGLLSLPVDSQPTLPWIDIAEDDPLFPPQLLLRWIASLEEPLIPVEAYPAIRSVTSSEGITTVLLPTLDPASLLILNHLIDLSHKLLQSETNTRMSSLALAIVLAPTLIRSDNPLDDASLCLPPGKQLPAGMGSHDKSTTEGGMTLVGLLDTWIRQGP